MVGICKVAESCSLYKKGECTGCDCSCVLQGSDEYAMLQMLYNDPIDDDPNEFIGN